MTENFECQDNGCEVQPETPEEALRHTAATGHTLTRETPGMTWTIGPADDDDEDEGDSEA